MKQRVKVHFHLVQDEDGYPPVAVESVWAQLAARSGEYVIDNVPFFARDATLGDIVHTREVDGQLWFDDVAHHSQNSLVRVVFFDTAAVEVVNQRVVSLGCSTEFMRAHNLLAVCVPITVSLRDLRTYLQAQAASGILDYEEPILRQ